MADIVDAATRSRMMSGIKGKDTKPEMTMRRMLHAAGFRYVLHDKRLPGKPDLVLPKYRTAIFVHGCFWHGHDGCKLFRLPKSRTEFWSSKIYGNIRRDESSVRLLLDAGWKVAVVWECALKGKTAEAVADVGNELARFIHDSRTQFEQFG